MNKEQAEVLYQQFFAGQPSYFTGYYKYCFYYKTQVEEVTISIMYGGEASSIYRMEFNPVDTLPDTLQELENDYCDVTITDSRISDQAPLTYNYSGI